MRPWVWSFAGALSAGAILIAILAASPATDAATIPPSQVVRATLSNGLRVVIVRNMLAPVVSTAVNYLVGSNEVPPGFPGMAHAQEHMMFRGSPGMSADQLAYIGSLMGGDFNADTRESLTQYLYTVPAEDLDVALHIEADRMAGVSDAQADWDKERGAIEQEVARDLSSPFYVLYEKLRATLFAGTPYAHDALGTRRSFDKTTAGMLKQFHDAWYAPNNAILIVVGDVDTKTTLGQIRALFGGIKSKKLPTRPVIAVHPVSSTAFTMTTDRPEGAQVVAVRMPGMDSPDFPALEVLSDVLNSQRFALYGLVPAGKAIETEFAVDPLKHAALGYAVATFSPNGSPGGLRRDLSAILRKVAHDGVPADLVAAAKEQERRQAEFQKNSIPELASIWSDAIALYGLNSPDEDLQRIEKVTVADVNRVARKYLDLDHAVFVEMTPQVSGRPVSSAGGFGGKEEISLGKAANTSLPEWARSAVGRLEVPPSTVHPVVSTLSNGLTLLVQPEKISDTVAIYGHIRNRPDTETPPGQEGVAQILDQLFSYGTTHLDRLAFQQALDRIGATESAGTNFQIKVLSGEFDRAASLLADNELSPALPKPAFQVAQGQLAQIVAGRNESPGYLTMRSLVKALFPPTDPSLRQATSKTVRALTLNDVRDYYRRVFRPDLTTIVVIGNTTPEKARAVIEKYFGSWQASGPVPPTDLPPAPPNQPATVAVPDNSRVQDSVTLGQTVALARSDPGYYALELGSNVLGGGFYSSRLSTDLRKNSGLVYSVSSDIQAGRTRSAYFVRFASDPDNVSKAADIVRQDISNMQTTPVPVEELDRTKALLLRQIPLREASVNGIAGRLLRDRELDLPLDEPQVAARRYIALTPQDVQAAFRRWMRPQDLVRVSQGPAAP